MNDKLYNHIEDEDTIYSDQYAAHVNAMTAEDLHSKSDIACELAARDIEIETLKAQLRDAGEEHKHIINIMGTMIPLTVCDESLKEQWRNLVKEPLAKYEKGEV